MEFSTSHLALKSPLSERIDLDSRENFSTDKSPRQSGSLEDLFQRPSKVESSFCTDTAADSDEEEEPLEPVLAKQLSESFIKNITSAISTGWTILDKEIMSSLTDRPPNPRAYLSKSAGKSIDSLAQYSHLSYDQHRQRFLKTLVQKKVLTEETVARSASQTGSCR